MHFLYFTSNLHIQRKIFALVVSLGQLNSQMDLTLVPQPLDMVPLLRACYQKQNSQVGVVRREGQKEEEIKALTMASSSLLSLVSSLFCWPVEERASLLRLVSISSVCLSPSRPRWKHGYNTGFSHCCCCHCSYCHHPQRPFNATATMASFSLCQFTYYQLFIIIHIRVVIVVKIIMLS